MNKGLISCILLALISCHKDTEGTNIGWHQASDTLDVASVRTGMSEYTEFTHVLECNGKIKPRRYQKVYAQMSGTIRSSIAKNGTPVKKGDLIISFIKHELALKLERAKVDLYKASLEFQSQLIGYTSAPSDISDSIRHLLKASSGLAFAELDVMEMEMQLEKASIYAPFDGVLADVKAESNYTVRSGDELFSLFSVNDLYVDVRILETDLDKIKVGDKAHVFPISNLANEYRAAVDEINPKVDEDGMIQIRLKVPRPNGLLPGMNARVLIFAAYKRCIVVPKEAIVMRDGKSVVFTLEGEIAKWNYVTTGLDNGTQIEVTQGLRAGEKVIVSHNTQLSHGVLVNEEN